MLRLVGIENGTAIKVESKQVISEMECLTNKIQKESHSKKVAFVQHDNCQVLSKKYYKSSYFLQRKKNKTLKKTLKDQRE